MRSLSRYFSDDDLREVLAGCVQGVEMWIPHPQLPYMVSNLGSVWSESTGRVLKPYGHNGYQALRIAGRHYRVHTLVLEAFISSRPLGMDGCHWDGNSRNNRLDNLRWDTKAANGADRRRHGWESRINEPAYRAAQRHKREVVSRVLAECDRTTFDDMRRELSQLGG